MGIAVFGEINIDLIVTLGNNESKVKLLQGSEYNISFGGRAGNQAFVASQLGAKTYLVGRVGKDAFGKSYINFLKSSKINNEVVISPNHQTGVTVLGVTPSGEYVGILVISSVNNDLDESDVDRFRAILSNTKVSLFQLGIPISTLISGLRQAKEMGNLTILDPSPVPEKFPPEIFPLVDILTPNQNDAMHLVGFDVPDTRSAQCAAEQLRKWGTKTVIIKMGDQGVFCSSEMNSFSVPSIPANVKDTIGAGDAFNAGLAFGIIKDNSIADAIQVGIQAGSLAVTGRGAQSAFTDPNYLQSIFS